MYSNIYETRNDGSPSYMYNDCVFFKTNTQQAILSTEDPDGLSTLFGDGEDHIHDTVESSDPIEPGIPSYSVAWDNVQFCGLTHRQTAADRNKFVLRCLSFCSRNRTPSTHLKVFPFLLEILQFHGNICFNDNIEVTYFQPTDLHTNDRTVTCMY